MPSAYLQWQFHSGERVVARGPLVFKLYVVPCVKGGLKICINGHGPLSILDVMPIYGRSS